MSKFHNKFRIESSRLKDFDYSTPWWYYVTISTRNHVSCFGKIENRKMILNELGETVEKEWLRTTDLRKNVELDYYIVMPNHFHGIIILNENLVETRRGVSLQQTNEFSKPIKNSLSVIINQFKGAVKRWCNKSGYTDFVWQSSFYDRIIRNEKELYNIRKYIEQNPLKWEFDRDELENIFDL